jgi:hypothetical protein
MRVHSRWPPIGDPRRVLTFIVAMLTVLLVLNSS